MSYQIQNSTQYPSITVLGPYLGSHCITYCGGAHNELVLVVVWDARGCFSSTLQVVR